MKKKFGIIVCSAIAVLLCSVLIVSSFTGTKISSKKAPDVSTKNNNAKLQFIKVDSPAAELRNERFVFKLNTDTTHFEVTELSTGKTFSSVPSGNIPTENSEEYLSEIILNYYDNNSSEVKMTSYKNSVEGKSYTILSDNKSIRVYYSVQSSKKKFFVPSVISQKVFEKDILSKLGSGQKRRLKLFYSLYNFKNNDSDTKEMKEKYSSLNNENFYILNGTATEYTYSEITGYMDNAGYTPEKYSAEAKRLGISSSDSNSQQASFVVPIQYTLTRNGFSVTVLTDEVSSDSDNYKLTNITLLPYFSCCTESLNGWMLVPDGSGAIINLNEKPAGNYSQNVWGNDLAVESVSSPSIMQNCGLPVFAMNTGEKAFLASITGAAATARINAEVFGNECLQSHIYTQFNIMSFDSSDVGELRNQAQFNIYSNSYSSENPSIEYNLFGNGDVTYSDMAQFYRNQLIDDGILKERLKSSDNIPMFVDFSCYETSQSSFLGIATIKKNKLSALKEINKAISQLNKNGINNLNIRLKAYGNGGLYGTAPNGFDIDSCVGDKTQLLQLARKLGENNGRIYLENNLSTVYYEQFPYKKMVHASRNLRKTVVNAFDYDLVARKSNESTIKYYLTSPAYFDSLTQNFINDAKNKINNFSNIGYSWSDYGSKLWSDFNENNKYDRSQSKQAAVKAAEKAKKAFGEIVTDGSNSYILKNVSSILNLPLSSSELSCESYSVPFYQMVIHGYIDFYGAPENTGTDIDKNYLASAESGAGLYYSCYTSDDNPLKNTNAGKLIYPTYIESEYELMKFKYDKFNEIFKSLRNQVIIKHECIKNNVFVTTYENGCRICVNYSNSSILVENVEIPAKDFAVINTGGN